MILTYIKILFTLIYSYYFFNLFSQLEFDNRIGYILRINLLSPLKDKLSV